MAAAAFVWLGRWLWAASTALALVVAFLVPRVVAALYVRPNEISLEQPYIQTHIHATRSAYGLEQHVRHAEKYRQRAGRYQIAFERALERDVSSYPSGRGGRKAGEHQGRDLSLPRSNRPRRRREVMPVSILSR